MLSSNSEEVRATNKYVSKKVILFEDDLDIRKSIYVYSIDYEAVTLLSVETYHAFLTTKSELHNIRYKNWASYFLVNYL
jgi:hypothetical protein